MEYKKPAQHKQLYRQATWKFPDYKDLKHYKNQCLCVTELAALATDLKPVIVSTRTLVKPTLTIELLPGQEAYPIIFVPYGTG